MGLIKCAVCISPLSRSWSNYHYGSWQYKYQKLDDDSTATRGIMFEIVTISAVTYGLHCLLCHGKWKGRVESSFIITPSDDESSTHSSSIKAQWCFTAALFFFFFFSLDIRPNPRFLMLCTRSAINPLAAKQGIPPGFIGMYIYTFLLFLLFFY